MKNSRQLILVIVEGKSEIDALEYPLNELYEQYGYDVEIRFPTLDSNRDLTQSGGDITSQRGVNPGNIGNRINSDIIDPFLLNIVPFGSKNILNIDEVIQIVDLDGAFIDPRFVFEDNSSEKTKYYSDGIYTIRPDDIRKRNAQKQENLRFLISKDSLCIHNRRTVPYSVYFFSSNLDHFFSNDANLEPQKKREKPSFFGLHYSDPKLFIPYFQQKDITLYGMNYQESWSWAMQELNSLSKRTNINVLIDKIISNAPNR